MKRIFLFATVALAMLSPVAVRAADYQWSVSLQGVKPGETPEPPRAFLWIPPQCRQVRAVVLCQHNMEEELILENPSFRKTLAELGVAEVWVTPGFQLQFNYDLGAGEVFDSMMNALASESGYGELRFAPVIPMGHSAAASFPWNFGFWNPARIVAAVSVSGQWPFYRASDQPNFDNRSLDGIPGLVTMGEYEDAYGRAGEGLRQRAEHPKVAISDFQEPGAGHFDASQVKIDYIALYIKKAMQYRVPPTAPLDGPVTLNPIDPTRQGWLADRWRKNESPKDPAAPVDRYTGDPKDAFWFFDEELVRATERQEAVDRGKKVDLLGYVQEGKVVAQNPKLHAQVRLRFLPEADGITFKLTGQFIDTVPEGRPEGWTGLPKGSHVDHATGGGPVAIERICGPVRQLGPDTFSIRYYRMGMTNTKRSGDIWLLATHPGDPEYRRVVQQSQMGFPLRNTEGASQTITFDPVPNQRAGVASIRLHAASSAGVPVYFYVREGPAEVADDGTLTFTPVPPRAKFPVKVTVVAWQFGRGIEPRLKTADPVERTFLLTK
jgi:hypothetical protein